MPKANPIEAAVTVFEELGFLEDGATRTEHVRIGTSRSPVYGGTGGELRVFGGRMRMALPGTDIRATVGKVSVCVYRAAGKGQPAQDMRTFGTRELDMLREAVAALQGDAPKP